MLPGMRPTALLIVAVTGGTPKATSAGKVMRVPEPTIALIVPAPSPASSTRAASRTVMQQPFSRGPARGSARPRARV